MIDPEYDCQDAQNFYLFEEKRALQKLRSKPREQKSESLQSIQRRLGVSVAEAMEIQKSKEDQ